MRTRRPLGKPSDLACQALPSAGCQAAPSGGAGRAPRPARGAATGEAGAAHQGRPHRAPAPRPGRCSCGEGCRSPPPLTPGSAVSLVPASQLGWGLGGGPKSTAQVQMCTLPVCCARASVPSPGESQQILALAVRRHFPGQIQPVLRAGVLVCAGGTTNPRGWATGRVAVSATGQITRGPSKCGGGWGFILSVGGAPGGGRG